MLTIVQISTLADIAAARDLVREFIAWAFTLEPDSRDAPTFHDLERELAALPGDYAPPKGCFLLARREGHPVGCVAFRAHTDNTVELKRMYVRPDQRRKRIGQELVSALIAEARKRNNHRIVLDSHRTMTGAHRIYRAAGFSDVAAPAGFPQQFRSRVVFMEMDLG
jgi:GNAT superfamily N-acetyltransferase